MIKYFVEWGMKRGWQCCENFDVAAYRRNNKDIAQELGDEYEPYYMHYINYGQYENRVTKAAYSEGVNYELVFDAEYYYNAYPDVAKKYGYDYEKLLNHFIIFGMKEGRTGSINFILDIYKINNPDLTAAYGEDNKKYYMHYIYDGFYEDRIAAESTVYLGIDYSAVYDKTYYYQNNADLRETIGDNERALIRHFVENGMAEGRQGSSEFNAGAYRAKYSDLRVMYKTDMKRYYQHYMRTGKKEGRSGEIFQ
jgi:hypothetical protein